MSIFDVFTTLATQCTISMLQPIGLLDPRHVLDTIAAHGVHFAFFVPSVLRLLLHQCEAEQRWHQLTRLQCLFTIGEAFDVPVARALREHLPDLAIWNGYGPAEATVMSNCYRLQELELQSDSSVQSVAIGCALPGYMTCVVHPVTLSPVADGEVGELLVGGPAVMMGYLRRAELTATALVHLPLLSSTPLYRTGDLCYVEPATGLVHYIGRVRLPGEDTTASASSWARSRPASPALHCRTAFGSSRWWS